MSQFWKEPARKDGLKTQCKPCHHAKTMEWKDRNKDRVSIYNKRARDKAYYFYRYGITNEEWLAIDVAQGGKCAICGVSGKLVVDHCHETDRVRGLLCQPCNKLLGNAKDREETLLAAIEYLRKT